MRRRLAPAVLSFVPAVILSAEVARATQALPIIVTYEMERRRDAERVERRDPREFWVRQILARLEDKKPSGAIGLKQPATAQVSFTVARDGSIVAKTVAKTSGVPAVDKEALAMLDRAQPFPADAGGDGRAVALLQPSVALPLDLEP